MGEEAPVADLRAALAADLGHTRRGPAGDEDCATLWARLRPAVAVLGVEEIDTLVAELGAVIPRIPSLDLSELRHLAARARELSEACRRLTERAED